MRLGSINCPGRVQDGLRGLLWLDRIQLRKVWRHGGYGLEVGYWIVCMLWFLSFRRHSASFLFVTKCTVGVWILLNSKLTLILPSLPHWAEKILGWNEFNLRAQHILTCFCHINPAPVKTLLTWLVLSFWCFRQNHCQPEVSGHRKCLKYCLLNKKGPIHQIHRVLYVGPVGTGVEIAHRYALFLCSWDVEIWW